MYIQTSQLNYFGYLFSGSRNICATFCVRATIDLHQNQRKRCQSRVLPIRLNLIHGTHFWYRKGQVCREYSPDACKQSYKLWLDLIMYAISIWHCHRSEQSLRWVHWKSNQTNIYFISSSNSRHETNCIFIHSYLHMNVCRRL